MAKIIGHLKQNLIAYLALFVALGGTSYAALRIPAGSVGNRQLKNHAVTPIKLDGGRTAGYVADWAQIDSNGHLVASRPRGATILSWNAQPDTPFMGGGLRWNRPSSAACFPMVSAVGFPTAGPAIPASVSAEITGAIRQPFIVIRESEPTAIDVAIVCPIP